MRSIFNYTLYSLLTLVLISNQLKGQAPANDDKANAIQLDGIINGSQTQYSNENATTDVALNTNLKFNVWFSFTGPQSGEVTIDFFRPDNTGNSISSGILELRNSTGDLLGRASLANQNDGYISVVGLNDQQQYFLVVGTSSTSTSPNGVFGLKLSDQVNFDYKAGAMDVSQYINDNSTHTFSNEHGTTDNSGLVNMNWNVWLKFTSPSNGVLTLDFSRTNVTNYLSAGYLAILDNNNNLVKSLSLPSVASGSLSVEGLVNNQDGIVDPDEVYYITIGSSSSNDSAKGSFDLSLSSVPNSDLRVGAEDVSLYMNGCSPDAYFDNQWSTTDDGFTAFNHNMWLRFKAPSSQVKITVFLSDGKGTLRNAAMLLEESDGTQVATANAGLNGNSMEINATGLTVHEWYYLSVGTNTLHPTYKGSFTLCLQNELEPPVNDNKADASLLVLTPDGSFDSGETAYTLVNATADESKPANWSNDVSHNVWFEFQPLVAASNITITGALADKMVAVYDEDNNLIHSETGVGTAELVLLLTGLDTEKKHYINVDAGTAGTFGIKLGFNNDLKANALPLTLVNGKYDSENAAFTTVGATGDEPKPSRWTSDPQFNVWFKFKAQTSGDIRVDVKTENEEGTLNRPRLVLLDNGGLELASNDYMGDRVDMGVSATGLVAGEDYFISVGNQHSADRNGTFTLSIDENASHDLKANAIMIPSIDNYCSELSEFTTAIATADGPQPSRWATGPQYNVWFEFKGTASGEARIDVKTFGPEGTLNRPRLAVYDGDQELASNDYMGDHSDVGLSLTELTDGATYHLMVGNAHTTTYRNGSFTLCIDDEVSHDFRDKAILIEDPGNYQSAIAEYSTAIGTPDGNKPSNWSTDPNTNVWFTFVAPVTGSLRVDAKVFGAEGYGTLGRPRILVEEAGGTEIGSIDYQVDNSTTVLEGLNVVKDEQYYISVDGQHPVSYRNGSFTLATRIIPDFLSGVTDLTALIDNCGTNTAYNNNSAVTNNLTTASIYNNEWFQVTAPESGNLKVTLDLTASGSIADSRMILTDQSGANILAEVYDTSNEDFLEISATGLNGGDTYFLSVGSTNTHPLRRGTFGICLEDEVTFDYKIGATSIPSDQINNCANPTTYSNRWATTDNPTNIGIYNNVWFSLKAPNSGSLTVTLDLSAVGSINNARMMLLNDEDEVLAEVYHTSGEGSIEFSVTDLDADETYYLTVGSTHTHILRRGIFSLCLTDEATFDYKEGAVHIPSELINNCANPATYSNRWATTDNPTDIAIYNNVWFDFVAPDSRSVTVTLDLSVVGSINNARMMLLNDEDEVLAEVYHTSGEGSIEFSVTDLDADETYYLTVGSTHTHILRRGIFSLCLTDEATFDYKEGAVHIPSELINNCANPATYSNRWATTDNPTDIGIYNNVWFDFVAPDSRSVTITLDLSAVGRISDARMMLLNDKDSVLAEVYHTYGEGFIEFSVTNLDADETYYLTVGSTHTHILRRGTFSLCLTDKATFDHKVSALDLTGQINNCGNPQLLTNRWATTDDDLSFTIVNNVWFEWNTLTGGDFTVQLDLSATGSLGRARMAVLNEAGNVVAQVDNSSGASSVELSFTDLPANQRYYVTVGSYDSHPLYRGSFSLCITSPDIICETELWAVASGSWNDPTIWSTTEGGTSGGSIPCENTIVHIKGFDILFTSGSFTVKRINISGQDVNVITGLTIQSGELSIKEEVKTSGPGIRLRVAQGANIRLTGED